MRRLLTLSLPQLTDAVLPYVRLTQLAPISLSCLLIEGHEAAPLLLADASGARTQRVCLTVHAGFHATITLSFRLVSAG